MREQIRRMAQKIRQMQDDLQSRNQLFRQTVDEYNQRLVEHLKEKLRAEKMTWCTRCDGVFPEGETELLLVEGREMVCESQSAEFTILHQACSACRKHAASKHGTYGGEDSRGRRESFYAFRVEKREDGYYALRGNKWEKVPHEFDPPEPTLSSRLIDKLVGEFNLPPRID